MLVKEKLIEQLKQMNLKSTDTVLIHSALSKIKIDAFTIIETLKTYFNEGLILMPTLTWKTVNKDHPLFDVNNEKSITGKLTELFRTSSGVYRSNHPTHSMAGYGKEAKSYLKNSFNDLTPTSPKGPWGRLINKDAIILHIGCNLDRSTFIHALEEKYKVPNRLSDKIEYYTIKEGKYLVTKPFIRHFSTILGVSDHYIKLEDELFKKDILKTAKFGQADVKYYKAKVLDEYLGKILTKNPKFFDTF